MNNGNLDFSIFGGENPAEIKKRFLNTLFNIVGNSPYQIIAISTHQYLITETVNRHNLDTEEYDLRYINSVLLKKLVGPGGIEPPTN